MITQEREKSRGKIIERRLLYESQMKNSNQENSEEFHSASFHLHKTKRAVVQKDPQHSTTI